MRTHPAALRGRVYIISVVFQIGEQGFVGRVAVLFVIVPFELVDIKVEYFFQSVFIDHFSLIFFGNAKRWKLI